MNLLSFPWIHYLLREYTLVSLFSANWLWINYTFREFAMNSLSIWRIHYEFTWSFAKLPWIHYLFRENTMNSLSVWLLHYEFTMFSRLNYELTLCSRNSLSFTLIYNEFTIYFANSLWIHCLFLEFTMNPLSILSVLPSLFNKVTIILFNYRLESAIFLAHSL